MKPLFTLAFASFLCASATAQTTIANSGFESWGNSAPGVSSEPTSWYSNKSGSTVAALGPQTCFKDSVIFHNGMASVRVENAVVPILLTVVNGNVTTGVISAPTTNKADGYIGTRNYTDTTDQRRMAFTGRPDSLAGWYRYESGGTGEMGKVKVILHTGDYYDPETPATYHPDCTANKIAEALFNTPASTVSTWTRFSVPFTYTSSATPAFIMINMTSSADQLTTISGSKMWIDDLQPIYSGTSVNSVNMQANDINVYTAEGTLFVNAAREMDASTVLTVYDMTGKTIFNKTLGGSKFASFSLSYLPAGMYIYKLNNTTFTKTGKLAIQ
jgi:hypothetical protein